MNDRQLTLGRIVAVFGVQGWLKVESFTAPRSNLLGYRNWQLHGAPLAAARVEQGREQGRGMVVKLAGIDDRDQAVALVGAEIRIARSELPAPAAGEVYWVDLEGLEAFGKDGVRLGLVSHVFATGANDVLVIEGERQHLVPLVWDRYVTRYDPAGKRIDLDWDVDF